MKTTSQRQELQWFEYFPADTKLCVEFSLDPLLVDIGGFLGPDLTAFKQSHPAISGKLSSTLQDLPAVIDNVKDLSPGIEAMVHDFFAVQPVKGVKAYYLRSVLHDWPDKQSRC